MEYDHERAVADGVNVNYDVYRIKTKITEQGSKVESGYYIDKRDRETRTTRWEKLEEDFEYDPNTLDRDVVAVDQIRKIIQTFRDKVLTEIFPGRDICAQDPDLCQGRQPRRGYRQVVPRGVRQGQ